MKKGSSLELSSKPSNFNHPAQTGAEPDQYLYLSTLILGLPRFEPELVFPGWLKYDTTDFSTI